MNKWINFEEYKMWTEHQEEQIGLWEKLGGMLPLSSYSFLIVDYSKDPIEITEIKKDEKEINSTTDEGRSTPTS